MPNPESCKRCARVLPWLSLGGNFTLGVYKLAVGIIGRSAALVADATHSFADVLGSLGILVALKVSSRPPDDRHPYGYGKAEFIGATFTYTLLTLLAVAIIVPAFRHMLKGDLAPPHLVTLLGAIVSIVYNWLMYRYGYCIARRVNSPAILADAFENRADAISSVACVIGIAGAVFIHPILDPIAAIVVGLIILKNSVEQLREAVGGLMDRAIPGADEKLIRAIALSHEGVVKVAYVRTRQVGGAYWADVGVCTEPDATVGRADAIVSGLEGMLMRNPKFKHVTVYILPGEAKGMVIGSGPAEQPA